MASAISALKRWERRRYSDPGLAAGNVSATSDVFAPAPVQRYFGMPVQTLDYFDHPCRYDTSQATADLRAVGVACPAVASYVGPMGAFYRAHRDRIRRAAMV